MSTQRIEAHVDITYQPVCALDKSRGELRQLVQEADAQSVGTLIGRLKQSGLLNQQKAARLVSEIICTGSHTGPFEEPSSGCPSRKDVVRKSFKFYCEADMTLTPSEMNAEIAKATRIHFAIEPIPVCSGCSRRPVYQITNITPREVSFIGRVRGLLDLEDN